jgi:hypothetical protein
VSKIINPYFAYAVSFAVALLAYPLAWSEVYPPLSFTLVCFIAATILLHTFLAFRFKRNDIFNLIRCDDKPPIVITIIIYLLWTAEFMYAGGIPLLKIILNEPYDYKTFGIPTLHVFIVTFSSFYTVYLFHLFLSVRRKSILILLLINLAAGFLIYNRGMLIFNLFSAIFIYLIFRKRYSWKHFAGAGLAFVLLLFLFGVMGSLRVSRQAGESYSNKDFLQTGVAKKSFIDSAVPAEFFWGYIYITSPLANLQTNINTYRVKDLTWQRLLGFVNNEIAMDFISKRLNTYFNIEREKENTIPGPFNVSTVYSRSYSYVGWPGMLLMACLLLFIPVIYNKLVPVDSTFYLTGLGILCTMFLFLAFDNTIRFTGLSFQLAYPVLLHFAAQISPWIKSLFVNNKVTIS